MTTATLYRPSMGLPDMRLPDFPHALAYQHIRDLRTQAASRRDVPARPLFARPLFARPLFARTRRSVRAAVRWLWAGQLALVPQHLVDSAPPRTSY